MSHAASETSRSDPGLTDTAVAAMSSIFFTGYPGFLGSELLPRILRRDPQSRAVCLVQPKFLPLARERAAPLADRVELIEGDITAPIQLRRDDIVEIYHLAAVYDLSVKREVGMRVNVEGTKHVLDFAKSLPNLRRLHYVSTCYVSGRYPGTFTEDDLEKAQSFNNYYEETKYLAEVEVRRAMSEGLRATIYRPSVVVGDSRSGATQKYDGPYFVMRWILRQPHIAFLPVLGGAKRYTFNVVPRDFIIDAIEALSGSAASIGKTYQLAHPEPMTIDETIESIAFATGHAIVRIPLPKWMAKGALDYVPGVYRLLRIPSPAVDYFAQPTRYDTTNAQHDLGPLGIRVPRFREYLPRLVEFVRAHPEVSASAMA
jgi:nucleoside-diphosphate-sugar epimerase